MQLSQQQQMMNMQRPRNVPQGGLSRQASNQSQQQQQQQRQGGNQMLAMQQPLMNVPVGRNNVNGGGMLMSVSQARRQTRLMNAYRMGGATNAQRLRRAQQVGMRMPGGGQQQQQRQQNNNQLVGGVSILVKFKSSMFPVEMAQLTPNIAGEPTLQAHPEAGRAR